MDIKLGIENKNTVTMDLQATKGILNTVKEFSKYSEALSYTLCTLEEIYLKIPVGEIANGLINEKRMQLCEERTRRFDDMIKDLCIFFKNGPADFDEMTEETIHIEVDIPRDLHGELLELSDDISKINRDLNRMECNLDDILNITKDCYEQLLNKRNELVQRYNNIFAYALDSGDNAKIDYQGK